MGNYFTANTEDNLKRNRQIIAEMNAIKIQRQMLMLNEIRERIIALQIAREREFFFWYAAFYVTSTGCAVLGYRYYNKRLIVFTPLIPLSFIMAYQADLAYGNKLQRIRVEAEKIMQYEQKLLVLPQDLQFTTRYQHLPAEHTLIK